LPSHTSRSLQFTELPSLSQPGNEARLSAIFLGTLIAHFGDIDSLGCGFYSPHVSARVQQKKKGKSFEMLFLRLQGGFEALKFRGARKSSMNVA